ncbi:MAG: L-serine ammonia-lyase, partial [Gammaproteobacteria bacterium]|nr:L-serine ammonia-lyase [Gammaproteobacteria bacterium]
MSLSVFDIFKIGIGPSSSHTMGPMRAAREFVLGLERDELLAATEQVTVRLYGSLALTGLGHGTDRAVLVGLEGADPETADPDSIEPTLQRIRASNRIRLLGRHEIEFEEKARLLLLRTERLPGHPNGMRFTAMGSEEPSHPSASRSSEMRVLRETEYYSIGGGFIVRGGENEAREATERPRPPYPFNSAAQLLSLCRENGLELFELVLANERTWKSEQQIRAGVLHLWQVMQGCVERGFHQTGVLP